MTNKPINYKTQCHYFVRISCTCSSFITEQRLKNTIVEVELSQYSAVLGSNCCCCKKKCMWLSHATITNFFIIYYKLQPF